VLHVKGEVGSEVNRGGLVLEAEVNVGEVHELIVDPLIDALPQKRIRMSNLRALPNHLMGKTSFKRRT
jgi:hypothetical protein